MLKAFEEDITNPVFLVKVRALDIIEKLASRGKSSNRKIEFYF